MNNTSASWVRRTLVAGAATALPIALAGPAVACGVDGGHPHHFAGALRDLQTSTVQPFDGARASLTMRMHRGMTTFVLSVRGINRAAVGEVFGAHLHIGPCVKGDGAVAGAHYNVSALHGDVPPVVSDRTEVWLDFTVTRSGRGHAVATVPFAPAPGNRAIVVHAAPTAGNGTAGARLACLPVSW